MESTTIKIKKAINNLGIEKKDIYTMGEMNLICKFAECSLIDVMHYLRYER